MKRVYTLVVAAVLGTAAAAHEAPSGMHYDTWCCSGMDCSPLSKATQVRGTKDGMGQWSYCNAQGNCASPEPGFTRFKASEDGQTHACVWQDLSQEPARYRLRCLYLPPGN